MNYIVHADPNVSLDLMVEESFYPQLVSYFERMKCRYTEERAVKPVKDRNYRVLKDISGPNGASVGELLGLFYSLEWGSLREGETGKKFYIMIHQRRKGKKKNAGKNRKEADQGSNGGDSGEPAGYSEQGPVGGPAGDSDDAGYPGPDDLWELPRVE